MVMEHPPPLLQRRSGFLFGKNGTKKLKRSGNQSLAVPNIFHQTQATFNFNNLAISS
jgi:hypothetical protein